MTSRSHSSSLAFLLAAGALLGAVGCSSWFPPPQPRVTNLVLSPQRACPGDVVTVSWTSANASGVTVTTPAGTQHVGVAGSLTFVATGPGTITARADGGSASGTMTQDVDVLMAGSVLAVGDLWSRYDASANVWVAQTAIAPSAISPRATVDLVTNPMTVPIGVRHDAGLWDIIPALGASATLAGPPAGTWRVARDVRWDESTSGTGPGVLANLNLRCL